MKKIFLLAIVVFLFNSVEAQKERQNFKIMFYNVENYFDVVDDPEKADEEYLPGGFRGWNNSKYYTKQANISKVNLSKYLGVSRQMVYNYFDGDDLSKLPNEKCQLLFNLLDVTSEKEILDINITNDYLQRVGSKIFDTKKSTPKKEESIDLAGLKKDEIMLIGEISQMLKNILIENKGREGEAYTTVEYVHHFIENLSTTKELKYI